MFELKFKYLAYEKCCTNNLLSVSALGSIIITILGLAGLAYFLTRKRLKEVAIRKIHGATSSEILY